MKKKPAVQCPQCRSLTRTVKRFAQIMFALEGTLKAQKEEITFYRQMMQDLVDDYLVRRNPFQGERKP